MYGINCSLHLSDAIKSIFEDTEERENITQFLGNFLLTSDDWIKKISERFDKDELKEAQNKYYESNARKVLVKSYDAETRTNLFFECFCKFPNLKDDLFKQIFLSDNGPWLRKMFEDQKVYFLVSDSHWKNPKNTISAEIDLVLLGRDKIPTIEINIL